ncbi:tRNA lysidine(34) synthetase TilS [bacterium]|nr:tRNA lysidine(34) synthetase TilS [bacterium]
MEKQIFENNFIDFASGQNLIFPEQKIVVAVSGGPDSIVLLHLLYQIKKRYRLKLAVAHLNHCLRGEESDRDEDFVRNLAEKYGIMYVSQKSDVKKFSKENRFSIEESARKVRYAFLESVRQKLMFDSIATGHNANDQAETILMNLARGSGIRGLGGIRSKRGCIIRPLLFAERKEIENYAYKLNLPYVIDSSNVSQEHKRNRFRMKVFPAIQEASGHDAVSSIAKTGRIVQDAFDFLVHEAENAYRQIVIQEHSDEIILDIVGFISYFRIIQEIMLIRVVEEFFGCREQISVHLINRLINLIRNGKSGSVVEIGSSLKAYKSGSTLAFINNTRPIEDIIIETGKSYTIPGTLQTFSTYLIKKEEAAISFSENPFVEYADFSKLNSQLKIRSWLPGDWFVPLGMKKRKKIKDFFIDEKVPVYKRHSVPLLTDGTQIVWIAGKRLDDRYKITEDTEIILKLELKEKN